jgi:helix-turn-helix protein
VSTIDGPGLRLRAAREDADVSLTRMAQLTSFSKSYLGMVETGQRPCSPDIVLAYERVFGPIGDDMWRRRNITHPHVMQLKGSELTELLGSVDCGQPGSLLDTPTSLAADELLAMKVSAKGAEHLRRWMSEGETATLRVNSLSILARRSERGDALKIVEVLESDERVRMLSLASTVSRLMQYDWETCRSIVRNPGAAPEPIRLARRLAKDAVDVKHAEARWCGAHLLRELVPVLGQ